MAWGVLIFIKWLFSKPIGSKLYDGVQEDDKHFFDEIFRVEHDDIDRH